MNIRIITSFIAFVVGAPAALALQADELLLIVNANVPSSVKTAEFYAKARLVPDGRILKLDLPGSEEISFERYEKDVVPAVREFLRKNGLETKVKCLVPFYGVPFRIGSRQLTPQENEEVAELKQQLAKTLTELKPFVEDGEKLARELDAAFVPKRGENLAELTQRINHAQQIIARSTPPPGDPRHLSTLARMLKLLAAFGGDGQVLARLKDNEIAQLLPDSKVNWPQRRTEIEKNEKEFEALEDKRFDAAARKRMREITSDGFGLIAYAQLLQGQLEYLQTDGTVSSLDNEIALLWSTFYNRSSYLPNPLNVRYETPDVPVLMVCRLDGPQEGTAMQIIIASLKAERDGLKGRVVIDSTNGTGPGGTADLKGGYRAFDDKLLTLARIVQEKTNFVLTMDKRPAVLPPNTVRDVALYCGWYSVRNYVPACEFKVGAVAYHVASFEMVSLRADNEKGWVAGLLNDGVAATCGAVAEPYLHAFPPPDEFFPLLMTGKLTLAEVYWKTLPMTSWMMVCIGDPLYTPFKSNPLLKPEEMPRLLQAAFETTGPVAPASALPGN